LEAITAADPQYKWQVEDDVVNLFPRNGDPALLNTRIQKFEAKQIDVDQALGLLLSSPEVQKREADLNLARLLRGGLNQAI